MAEPYKHIYKVDLNQPLKRFDVGDILASGDEKANSFEVAVYRDGANVDLSGCAVYGYFIRPNDETMKVDGTVDGNIVRVEPSKNCYVYDGAFSLAIKLTGSGITQTVAVFDGRIVRTTSDNIVDGDRVIYGLEDLLAQIAAVENATANADTAASNANTAASNADTATTRANQAAASIENVTASATELDEGAEATATVTEVDGAKHFTFGIPRGEKGEKGEKGDPGNVANVTITSIAGLPEALAGKQPVGDYLTADGTAADASKLGGKLPEAYATKENLEQYATKEDLENIDIPTGGTANVAYNLLDNSNFKNPVNQRRADGTISAVGYFIDRWKLISGSVTVDTDGLTLDGEIAQILENAPAADVTAAASAGSASFDAETNTFSLTASGELIEWAALYEGEYTAENMPTYVPKEYAVEFLECQRYFVTFNNYGNYLIPIANGYMANTNTARLLIRLPLPMRTTPTFGAFNVPTNGIQVRAGNSVFEGATITVLGKIENGVVIHCVLPSGKTTTAHDTMSLGFAPSTGGAAYLYFSADL